MKQKSLRQLAKELGVSASYLSQVRHGKRPPSDKVFGVLSTLSLGVKQSAEIISGRPYRTRTCDTLIKSQVLCQLS